MRLILIMVCAVLIGCSRESAVITDRNSQCPQNFIINGWTMQTTSYLPHQYKYEYDSTGVAIGVCELCGWREATK